MDKVAKDFLIHDELERHLESMSEVVNRIDPRQQSKVRHSAQAIMLSALAGTFAGCQTWNEMADFAEERLEFLRTFVPDMEISPSHDTLRRFFCLIRPAALEKCYRDWASAMRMHISTPGNKKEEGHAEAVPGKHVAIDGKTICGAMNCRRKYTEDEYCIPEEADGMEKLHLVSAFLVDQCLSLGQERVGKKENEIVAIPRLLDSIDLCQGDVVTIDAIGTQIEIAEKIVSKEADYILEVKGNQMKIKEIIAQNMEDLKMNPYLSEEFYKVYHEDEEDGHGFITQRSCYVCSCLYTLGPIYRKWEGLKSYGVVVNKRTEKATGNTVKEKHYFITSLPNEPKRILEHKRKHWGIENGLHWRLDVTFNEDDDRKRKNSAQNYSIINKMVLAVLKNKEEKKKTPIKTKRMKAGWSEEYLKSLLIDWIKAF